MGFFDSDYFHPGRWLDDLTGTGSADPGNADREALRQQIAQQNQLAGQAGQFAGQAQGMFTGQDTANLNQNRQFLQDLASGKNSVAAEQLRQGLMQNQAAQQSMAAGASPANAAMAARNAALNMGRAGTAMAGQQALAGLQERNQANQALVGLNMGQRAQDLQGTQIGYGAANQGYGNSFGGYGTALGNQQRTPGQALMNAGTAVLGIAAQKSDARAKTDIEDGDKSANKTLAALKAYRYRYKDERDGKGEQFGVMAQDLEKAGLRHAVIDTPKGKYVDGSKAATSALCLVAALGKRVSNLEKAKK